ncbi:restriction endonuclease subunit S [Micromonospora aurantiaca]|uniref:restriction endonuclease subunit S n=1 Tax=Micromonospora aurantiaca (nom. illeg.) TaxID=47850 RepID=UPI0033A5C657
MTWPMVPLRRVITCLDGRRVPLNSEERAAIHGEVPYWGAGGVLDFVSKPLFSEPLVLLGEDGAPFFVQGKDVAYYIEGPVWVNNHMHVLRPDGCDGRFLTYALNAVDYANYITGSTRDKLTQEDLKQILVPMPPIEEQWRIVELLNREVGRIDRISDKLSELDHLLKLRWAATREELAGRLVSIAESPSKRLRYLCRPVDERVGIEDVPLLSVSIHRGVIPRAGLTDRESRADSFQNYKLCNPGDIILNRMRAFQGGVGVANCRGMVSPDYLVLRPEADAHAALLHHVFRSHRFVGEMTSRIRGIGSADQGNVRTPRINWDDLGEIRVSLPPLHGQAALADTLNAEESKILELRARISAQRELLAERRQALITAAVTGHIDVSTSSGRGIED